MCPPRARDLYRTEVYDPAAELASLGISAEPLDLRHYFGRPEALRTHLSQFDLVWVTGGNAFVLRRAMQLSGFDDIIVDLLDADAIVYGGFSAGAVVAAPSLEGIQLIDDPAELPSRLFGRSGLGRARADRSRHRSTLSLAAPRNPCRRAGRASSFCPRPPLSRAARWRSHRLDRRAAADTGNRAEDCVMDKDRDDRYHPAAAAQDHGPGRAGQGPRRSHRQARRPPPARRPAAPHRDATARPARPDPRRRARPGQARRQQARSTRCWPACPTPIPGPTASPLSRSSPSGPMSGPMPSPSTTSSSA